MLLDANGNPTDPTAEAEKAESALLGEDFGTTEPQPEGRIEVASPEDKVPEYDFGAGELGEKTKKLKENLAAKGLLPNDAVAEGAEEAPTAPAEEEKPLKGDAVDWSEFDLDENYAHFYPQAEFTSTSQGPKWVVVINEYDTFEKEYNGTDKDGKGLVDKKGQPRGLGGYITSRLNSPPDQGCGPWNLVAVLPGTMGRGAAVLMRKVPIVLPDPKPLETETKAEPVTPAEVDETDKAAAEWAGQPLTDVPAGEAAPLDARAGSLPENIAQAIAAEAIDGPDVG